MRDYHTVPCVLTRAQVAGQVMKGHCQGLWPATVKVPLFKGGKVRAHTQYIILAGTHTATDISTGYEPDLCDNRVRFYSF